MSDIEVIKTSLLEQIANAEDAKALDEARVAALGKKGQITELLKTLGSICLLYTSPSPRDCG